MRSRSNAQWSAIRRAALFGAALATLAVVARAEALSPAEKARLAKLDAGPKTIDVSKYPAEQKAGYALFTKKCAKCHSIARPINSAYALPDDWQRYIKRMMYKPDSKLSENDAKAVYRFLAYDSSVRKAEALRTKLAALPEVFHFCREGVVVIGHVSPPSRSPCEPARGRASSPGSSPAKLCCRRSQSN
jgi:cytochrome c5